MGRSGPVIAFIPPKPMDQSCWIFQMAHLSTWYRCVTFDHLNPALRSTPLAHYFANLFTERNEHADLQTIIRQFEALAQPYPDGHHERIACPTIILTGSEDGTHQSAFVLNAHIPDCELKVLPGAGHYPMEQPWLFDRFMIEFLSRHGLFPGASIP